VVELLSKAEALSFIDGHGAVFDHPSNPRNPFAGSAWNAHFVKEVVGPADQVVVAGTADSRSFMLLKRTDATTGGLTALSNYYSSLYSPLSSSAADRAGAIEQICEDLTRLKPTIATVKLSPLDSSSADVASVATAFGQRGWYAREYFCFGNWFMPCEGLSFDRYWEERDSQLRNTHQRKAKKLLSAGTLELISSPVDVDGGMDAFDIVYKKSWKKPEPYPNFVRGWARVCAERGWLRLGIARLGNVPIAVQLWFTIDRHAYIFKLAYDEDYAKWSAGTVLTAFLFRHALDVDRVLEVDYLTGDDPYKRAWMADRRERSGLLLCNLRSPRGFLTAAREWGGSVRSRLRGLRVASPVDA
jgi:hypothetical protein